jgi:hypothetical protein
MSKRENNEMREDGQVTVQKKRRHNLFSLIVCLLVAFVIWLYASSLEKKNVEEQTTNFLELPRTSEVELLYSEL